MLRIHLTAEDLLKTRFASQPAPLIETGHAIAALRRREPLFGAWRRSAAARFPLAARPLLDLIPPSATGPLFLDPVSADLAEGLELVQSAPASFVAEEVRRVSGSRPPGPWLRSLAARDRDTWRDLDRALRAAHRHLVEGAWPRILTAFRSDLAWRGRLIGEVGAQAAIASLHPGIGWNGTVLQIETPKELDFRPGGAGLTLMPTAMWTGRAMVAGLLDGPVTIVYPAVTPLPLVDEDTSDATSSSRWWPPPRPGIRRPSPPCCGALPAEAVEFPVPDAAEKGVPLIRREPQDGPRGVSAVPNADLAPGQARYLNAVAVGVAQRALDPVRT
jgi:hypothetical protein